MKDSFYHISRDDVVTSKDTGFMGSRFFKSEKRQFSATIWLSRWNVIFQNLIAHQKLVPIMSQEIKWLLQKL